MTEKPTDAPIHLVSRPARPGVAAMTKRRAAVALLVPAAVLAVLSTRAWVSAVSTDPVLGGGRLEATGTEVAPGILALALVSLAAAVAVLTTGPRLRVVSAVVLTVAALAVDALTVRVLLDPAGVLGSASGQVVGRAAAASTDASTTSWPWLALVVALVLTGAGLVGVPASRRWEGLSSRFERPDPTDPAAVSPEVAAQVARHLTWDDLSLGLDPTVDEADETDKADEADDRAPDPTDAKTDADGHRRDLTE